MARVTGRYENLHRGISQQAPQERRSGQHTEQVNMTSDPVRGLCRRRGSKLLDDLYLGEVSVAQIQASKDAAADYLTYSFYAGAVEHSLCYAAKAVRANAALPRLIMVNKATGQLLPLVRPASDANLDTLLTGGVSALTAVGRFIYLAGNTLKPTISLTDNTAASAQQAAIWIRAGTYSRTYTVKIKSTAGVTTTYSYKTLASSYGGVLDTSGISATDPEYTKKVTDLTNAYNTAVTQWTGQATASIQPENIAEQLRALIVAGGYAGTFRDGSTVYVPSGVLEITAEDGGDGTSIRAVGREVLDVAKLTNYHYFNKVTKIRPKNSDGSDAYYMKAVPKSDTATGTYGEVIWQECPGLLQSIQTLFCIGTVKSGTFYVASSAAALGTLIGETVPSYSPSTSGDAVTNPTPEVFGTGRYVNYLGVFQDRLVVGSGSRLLFSKAGDFLNFFKPSVTTDNDDDAVEIFAYGGESDTIRHSVFYDRNIVFFGDLQQYIINGRTPFTPGSAAIPVLSALKDTATVPPKANGNLVFFPKFRDETTNLHQWQTGVAAETPEASSVSVQLDSYLKGRPLEIEIIGSPNMVFMRTTGLQYGLYVYGYLDNPAGSERLWDAWFRWEWDPALGPALGLAQYQRNLQVLTVRDRARMNGGTETRGLWLVLDQFDTATAQSQRPYLDSQVRADVVIGSTQDSYWFNQQLWLPPSSCIAYAKAADTGRGFVGVPLVRWTELDLAYPGENQLRYVGAGFGAYVVLTNPFRLDRNGKPTLTGRTTISTMSLAFEDTGGFKVTVTDRSGRVMTPLDFSGRLIGNSNFRAGQQPIVAGQRQFTVAKETRECSIKIAAKTWLPFTATGMEWAGQLFSA